MAVFVWVRGCVVVCLCGCVFVQDAARRLESKLEEQDMKSRSEIDRLKLEHTAEVEKLQLIIVQRDDEIEQLVGIGT